MKQRWSIVIWLLWLLCPLSDAENFCYRIYLKDKGETPYRLDQPKEFLSVTALARRQRQQIAIDNSDLPISHAYLDSLKTKGVRIIAQSKWMRTVVIETADTSAIPQISRLPMVDSIRLVWQGEMLELSSPKVKVNETIRYQIEEEPGKDFYGSGETQIKMLKGERLHQLGFRGEGINIAVIDAGFRHANCTDAFDSVRIGGTYNVLDPTQTVFDFDDHGTKVLSCLAAQLPGILVGTAPNATYWLIKSEDSRSEYPIEEDYWLAAAEYADSVGVDIITSSLGYFSYDMDNASYTPEQLDGQTAFISRGASIAAQKGILIFSSAGNEGSSNWGTITVPGDANGILTVGAVDEKRKRCSFSSAGFTSDGRIKPDVVALGTGCAVIEPYGRLSFANGTSFATPILAGVCACAWQALPWLKNQEMIELIRKYASQHNHPDLELGYGLPDLYKLYKKERKHGPKER